MSNKPKKLPPPAPKGNQYAKGCKTSGRPRTISPPPENCILLGQEMLEWIEENQPLHLSEFYAIHKMYTESEWETIIKRPEFVRYYEIAKRMIGKAYLDKTSNIRDSVSHRFIRHYFKDVRDSEDEQAEFLANIKEKALAKMTQEDLDRLSDMLQTIRNHRNASVVNPQPKKSE